MSLVQDILPSHRLEDNGAATIERGFLELPGRFVAVVGVLPVGAGCIFIGGLGCRLGELHLNPQVDTGNMSIEFNSQQSSLLAPHGLQIDAERCWRVQGNLFPRTRLTLVGNPPFQIV